MNYYISDLHFGSENRYENRDWTTDQRIIQNWNQVVSPHDKVYILGDVCREANGGDGSYLIEILTKLNGKKILITGNHDRHLGEKVRACFTEICDYKEITDCYDGKRYHLILSHYPILIWRGQHYRMIHLYGHVHCTEEWNIYTASLKHLNEYFAANAAAGRGGFPRVEAYNVGCMVPYMAFTPRTLKELRSTNP